MCGQRGRQTVLRPVSEVGGEPVKCSALNTLLAQPFKEDGMVDSIKGCAESAEVRRLLVTLTRADSVL